jgi:Holliday junction resolvasome RuvABC endonuclease subunit
MTILALDLGTTTGFAFRQDGRTVWGTWSFKPGQFEGGGMRYLRFQNELNKLNPIHTLEAVYFEEVRAHKGTAAAHVYGGLMATLTAWCEANGVPYMGVPVGTIKRHATGKGNAKKPETIAAMQAKGFTPQNDNEADALALLDWAIEHETQKWAERAAEAA